MMDPKVLLLNASNMEAFPVYPYAFIQIPAVARREGIEVICQDLLGIPQKAWAQTLQVLINDHDPEMILITLRNTDSLDSEDYEISEDENGGSRAYFPIERTRALIAVIRSLSGLKIALGGFGFSVMPEDLMHYLRPDFGVFGDPNGFFHHFASLQGGNLRKIPNLLYFQDGRLISNPRKFYPPLSGNEYTPQAIEAMMAFYETFPKPGFFGAPIEIIRGCPHGCIFCSEPHVKGRQVRYRNFSAVMGDVEILVRQGITRLYMITSELNPEGNAFVLEMADRLQSFNKKQPTERKVTWNGANYLLNLDLTEYEQLYRSGFIGGWFDITALDDENARTMRTPYRNKSLLKYLKYYAQFESNKNAVLKAQGDSTPDGPGNQANTHPKDPDVGWTMFIGNPGTTIETIRNTLRVANQERLTQHFSSCHVNTNIRVFNYENPDQRLLEVTYSITTGLERTSYQQILPSFAYPPALLEEFGSENEISRILKHIQETYLSTSYQKSRDWFSYLRKNTTYEQVAGWLAALSEMEGGHYPANIELASNRLAGSDIQLLFSDEPQDEGKDIHTAQALQVVNLLVKICLATFPDLLESLGFPESMEALEQLTPYDLAVAVYHRCATWDEIEDELAVHPGSNLNKAMGDFVRFCIKAMLYKFNVVLDPKLKGLFVNSENNVMA